MYYDNNKINQLGTRQYGNEIEKSVNDGYIHLKIKKQSDNLIYYILERARITATNKVINDQKQKSNGGMMETHFRQRGFTLASGDRHVEQRISFLGRNRGGGVCYSAWSDLRKLNSTALDSFHSRALSLVLLCCVLNFKLKHFSSAQF